MKVGLSGTYEVGSGGIRSADAGCTGKGKITDMLSQQATLCCRAAGGHSK